jgi:hypothetical protein
MFLWILLIYLELFFSVAIADINAIPSDTIWKETLIIFLLLRGI